MKRTVDSTRSLTTILALLTAMFALSITAAPALADEPHMALSPDVLRHASVMEADEMRMVVPQLEHLIPALTDEAAAPADDVEGEGIPDGSDWDTVYPDDEPIGDGGGDEMVPDHPADEPADDAGDAATEDETAPSEDPTGDDADTTVPEEPAADEDVDEAGDAEQPLPEEAGQTTPEQPQADQPQAQPDGEQSLAFTGGDSAPWLVAGAAIAVAGAALLLRRRDEKTDR